MTSIKFLCKTCKKIVEADELDYLRNSDPHEGHDRVWLQRPTIENPSEVTPSVSIVEKDTFHSDVKEVRNVMGNLNSVIFERQDAIKGLVLALLAREHIIYYGPPGTGKNYMVDRFTQCIDHSFFEYQISQFTVLDELFGSYDLIHMRDTGEMRRVIDGKLLQAEVAFLDEIGNSSSPIRNALKGLMQERKYEYGKTRELAPLQTIVAASNSVLQFEEDATEQAFEDRFLFRDAVGYIQDPANELRMLQLYRQNSSLPVIPHATITRLQNYVREVEFSEEFMKSLIDFKHKIIEEAPGDIAPISDRRMFKLMSAVAAHAVLNGRTKAKRADLAVFQYIFWHDPSSQKLPVQEWVKAHLVSNLDKIDALRSSLNDIFASFEQAQSDDSSLSWADRMSNAMQTRALVQAQQKSMDRLRTQVEDEEEMEIVHSFDEQVKDTLAKITFATLQYEGNGDSDIEQLKK